jgi:hypothetical protein
MIVMGALGHEHWLNNTQHIKYMNVVKVYVINRSTKSVKDNSVRRFEDEGMGRYHIWFGMFFPASSRTHTTRILHWLLRDITFLLVIDEASVKYSL